MRQLLAKEATGGRVSPQEAGGCEEAKGSRRAAPAGKGGAGVRQGTHPMSTMRFTDLPESRAGPARVHKSTGLPPGCFLSDRLATQTAHPLLHHCLVTTEHAEETGEHAKAMGLAILLV